MMTNSQIAVLVLSKVNCTNTLAEDVIDIAIRSIIAWEATKKAYFENNSLINLHDDLDDILNEVSHMESEEMIKGFLEVKNENNDQDTV